MKKSTYLFILLFLSCFLKLNAQVVNMGDPGHPLSNPADCGVFGTGNQNFQDPGGAGNYPANYNDTIVFCPDLNTGTKMSISFGINAGSTFNIDGTDSIYVYDGSDATAPLLGVHNSVTDPTGFTHQASWNNPSGCLTIVFISDGAIEGTGWLANVQCGNQFQPFTPHLEAYINGSGPNAINPSDTGFVDVCYGDSILFITKPIFPNSLDSTGYGYSQNINTNITFDWEITDGNTYPSNDSIWFTPPSREGYLIDLKMTDIFPQNERIRCKVRVSLLPDFTGTGPLEDTVCIGENTSLLGGVTQQDTVGVNIPTGSFNLGGSYAGLTYLPDGSGQVYQAPINISGFPTGAIIDDPQDLNQVCITMEHSYLGDLEMWLECPNGNTITLLNSFSPGNIAGGFNGGGTFLGDPIDDFGGGGPGVGWEYCFSSAFNSWGDMPTEFAGGNTVAISLPNGNNATGNSMNPNGIYEPEVSFTGFNGCPINGTWTIYVQDNLSIDDGYIFEWGLFFDSSFFPGLGSYQTSADTSFWSPDPTIISGQSDTVLIVQPNSQGTFNYTFNIIDNFGCLYDTVVQIETVPLPDIFEDTIDCDLFHTIVNTFAFDGGIWSCADTAISFSDSSLLNPIVFTSTPGTYTVVFTDNQCAHSDSAQIEFPPYIYTQVLDTVICEGSSATIYAQQNPTSQNFIWSTGETGPQIVVSDTGNYLVSISNYCYTYTDTSTVENKICDIIVPNIISLSSNSGNNLFFVEHSGILEFECLILNRWGNLIYKYTDPSGTWDGKTINGDTVEQGTYFYKINATFDSGEKIQKNGFVYVNP
ncbi:MAG: gliding motility-associated C-terminal domain-containing protein [Crocinitomicaceae bacterium]|nr:gliding motility-associated C-terminal domain-containing protein [Crocinitomicaceae bacterium]